MAKAERHHRQGVEMIRLRIKHSSTLSSLTRKSLGSLYALDAGKE